MWSVRPFSPRCAAFPGERAAEAMAARLAAAPDRSPTPWRVELKRRFEAVLAPMDGLTDRPPRPLEIGCRDEGCPNEEKRGPPPAKFGTPPEKRAPPKPTPPPRLPTPPPTCPPPCPAAHVAGPSAAKVMPTSKLVKYFVFIHYPNLCSRFGYHLWL